MTVPSGSKDRVRYFDSHLHLTDGRFDGDRARVLEAAREKGVAELVTVGTDPADARAALELARAEEGVWCTAGLHPHAADAFGDDVMEALEALLGEPEVVAVGETGLDYHYDNAPRDVQRRSFEAHMELAAGRALPVVVHTREADADTAEVLERLGEGVTGVLHCYTAGVELLETGVELGWYVSFSGIATFGGFDAAPLVRRVPDDRLLIETDSPYLAPTPKRGRRNEPAFLPHTCAAVAEMRGEVPDETAALTRENARRLYGLDC